MRVYCDPGHGGPDRGGSALPGLDEANLNLAIALAAEPVLRSAGATVKMARINDQITNPSKAELIRRTAEANAWKADCCISIHNNSMGGSGSATGTETFVQRQRPESHELGKRIQEAVVAVMSRPDRGLKVRENTDAGPIYHVVPGTVMAEWAGDWYHVLRETAMPAVIIECGFMDHPADAELLRRPEILEALGKAIAGAVVEWGKARGLLGAGGTPIMGKPVATEDQARAWLAAKGAPEWARSLPSLYWVLGAWYGVRPDVALAQACKETAFFRFGGAVTPDQHNPAGIKIRTPKADRREDHATFDTWVVGIEAHIQHLFCYASKAVLPPGARIVDPRWDAAVSAYGRGSAPNVEDLGGKWAPNPDYGRSITQTYLASLLATEIKAAADVPDVRAEVDQERARADALQRRIDRAISALKGE